MHRRLTMSRIRYLCGTINKQSPGTGRLRLREVPGFGTIVRGQALETPEVSGRVNFIDFPLTKKSAEPWGDFVQKRSLLTYKRLSLWL